MTTASIRILGRAQIAVRSSPFGGRGAVHLSDLAVLAAREPLAEMAMELAAGDTTLSAVDLTVDSHAGELVLGRGR